MGNDRDGKLIALFAPMAAAVEAAAPDGWRYATLRVHATPFRGGAFVVYRFPDGSRATRDTLDLDAEVQALVQLAKGPGAGLEVVLDIASSGGYEAVVTPRSKRGISSGYICTLGGGRREEPEERQEPLDDSEAGDPEEALRLLEEIRRKYTEILGRSPEPGPPASAGELAELEDLTGVPLPADLRALYERAGHWPDAFYWPWLSAEELLGPEGYLDVVSAQSASAHWLVLDADPPGTVRRTTGHTGWIPFAYDGSGNYLAVDLAPARNGRPGQVIATGNDYDDGPGYVADSVTSLLRRQLAWLEAGEYDLEEYDGETCLEFTADCWHGASQSIREKRVIDLADLPGAITPKLQHLTVRCDAPVDLSLLAEAPLLKYLRVQCKGELDLSPLRGLPLELLDVSARSADLTPLTAHPSLRSLTVAAEDPIEVAQLRTLPRLSHLEVSAATVTDVETLADLPAIGGLFLSPDQWQEFRTLVDRYPLLSYAGLVGDVTSAEVSAWADAFPSPPAAPLLRHSVSPADRGDASVRQL